jgi:hypothetical protein
MCAVASVVPFRSRITTSRLPPRPWRNRESTPSSLDTAHAPPPPPSTTAEGSAGAVSRLRSLAVDALAALMLARELLRRSAALLERARAGR